MLISIILFCILGIVLLIIGFCVSEPLSDWLFGTSTVLLIGIVFLGFLGIFTGFVYYPATEGTHQGIITAVDLEGIWFRRYEVYLKSGGFTVGEYNKIQSDETKYLLYENEKELAEQLKTAIGKTVKIHYGHDGGYIGWKSCGTYHIKSIEILDE